MKLGGVVAAALIALTMVVMVGGAAAFPAVPRPGPTPPGPVQMLTYTVTLAHEPDLPGAPAVFTPLMSFAHPGPVQFHFVNQDRTPHVYVLVGLGIQVNLPSFGSVTLLAYLPHAAPYAWVSLFPYPGGPVGGTVGSLIVA